MYYGNPTQDMPGYPSKYWQPQASPFASMAANPNWEEDTEAGIEEDDGSQQVPAPFRPEVRKGSNAAEVNTAAWVFDTSDMAFP
jgi:hypothetical protein